jgi:acylphosphatase
MIAKHVIFKGQVQGVGFRFTAHRLARLNQLKGFVRNLPDGTVEMLAQGYSEDIDNCITDIKEYFAGHIREAKMEDLPLDPRYKEFNITF